MCFVAIAGCKTKPPKVAHPYVQEYVAGREHGNVKVQDFLNHGEEFAIGADENGKAVLELEFAEKKFKITISNPQKKEISKITAASCGEISLTQLEDKKVCLEKKKIQLLSKNERHEIFVETE